MTYASGILHKHRRHKTNYLQMSLYETPTIAHVHLEVHILSHTFMFVCVHHQAYVKNYTIQ